MPYSSHPIPAWLHAGFKNQVTVEQSPSGLLAVHALHGHCDTFHQALTSAHEDFVSILHWRLTSLLYAAQKQGEAYLLFT